ncbi:MAG: ROK family transcriptional regulator [Chloroflexota bacterium]
MAFPTKATHQQTRAHNSALVLRVLYHIGPISRAEIARLSGLTRTTVGELVGELLADGLAREVGRGPSTGGKAPILVELADDARQVIAVDLGEQAFRAAIVDLRGQIQLVVERPVDGLDGDRALALVYELIDELAAETRETLLGIGVGTPGIVDATSGTILWAVNLDWENLPLGDLLRDRYGVPAELANDSRAAALAIQLFGEPRATNLVAIKVGRRIGAGVVLGGELFHGDGFGAGEIGHTVVEEDGAECRCGRFGCLETVASSRAIVHRANEVAQQHADTVLGQRLAAAGELTLDDVRTALEAGDEPTRRIVASAGRYLGQSIAGLIGVLDVERIVLHGSVADLGEPWLAAVRDEASRRSLGLLARDTTIELAPPIGDFVVMGASALLITAELGLTVGR